MYIFVYFLYIFVYFYVYFCIFFVLFDIYWLLVVSFSIIDNNSNLFFICREKNIVNSE